MDEKPEGTCKRCSNGDYVCGPDPNCGKLVPPLEWCDLGQVELDGSATRVWYRNGPSSSKCPCDAKVSDTNPDPAARPKWQEQGSVSDTGTYLLQCWPNNPNDNRVRLKKVQT